MQNLPGVPNPDPPGPPPETVPPVPLPVVPLFATGIDAPVEPADPGPAAPRRFCNSCGVNWDPLWLECPLCIRRREAGAVPRGPAITGRPVVSALALYFTLLGTLLAAAIVVRFGSPSYAINVEIGVAILDAVIVLAWCGNAPREVLPLLATAAAPRWYAVALGAVPVTFALATVTVGLLVKAGGLTRIEYVRPVLDAGYGWPTIILLTCVQPAIFEELAFRGVILGGMRKVLSDNEAIIVSALLFMIIHLALLSFPHLVLIGLVLGYVRVRSGSLYPGMLAHGAHNLAVVLSEQWLG